ncbi:hypothetical protein CP533_3664 [Ophiocordyceps camponoti-saundersi (nom. inval.)]|nr:hypothetical protein CP533_3664 [Ophiocordyceps camponoti-saundersi (nom. inval.)]
MVSSNPAPEDSDETDIICVVCLDNVSEPYRLQPCLHRSFHFPCIDQWLRVDERRSCPVCKATVSRVEHGRGGFERLYVPSGIQRQRRRRVPAERDGLVGLSFRRLVYLRLRYSLYIGSNRYSGYRELDHLTFRADQGLQRRAKAFLRRELSSPSSERRRLSVERLVSHMVYLLGHFEIRGSDGHLEDLVTNHLGRENARLLLHELQSFLRSPFESLREWDLHVQYLPVDSGQPD